MQRNSSLILGFKGIGPLTYKSQPPQVWQADPPIDSDELCQRPTCVLQDLRKWVDLEAFRAMPREH